MHDHPLPLRFIPGKMIQADLREPLFMNFLRHGCIQHQIGEDILCLGFLNDGDIVFDIGANVGYTSMLYASIVGSSGHVTALEPSPRAYALLARNCATLPNVTIIQAAVSESSGERPFYETDSLDTSSLIPVEHARSYSVSTCAVDDISEHAGRPAFVKVDVEGHEHSVFRGMRKLLAGPELPVILFEASSPGARAESCALLQLLSNRRYVFHGILRDGSLCGVEATPGMSNYLAWPVARKYPKGVRVRGEDDSSLTAERPRG